MTGNDKSMCDKAPDGWICTRKAAHEGACAATETNAPILTPMFLANAAFCIEHWNDIAPDKRQSMIDKLLQASEAVEARHPDERAVDTFAAAMKAKMKAAREKGRSGWQGCPTGELSRQLRAHVEKGDPVDVANYCMMLARSGSRIAPRELAEFGELAARIHEATALKEHWYVFNADESGYCMDSDNGYELQRWLDDRNHENPEYIKRNGYHLVKRMVRSELAQMAADALELLLTPPAAESKRIAPGTTWNAECISKSIEELDALGFADDRGLDMSEQESIGCVVNAIRQLLSSKAAQPTAPVAAVTDADREEIRATIELIKTGAEQFPKGWSGTIEMCDDALTLLARLAAQQSVSPVVVVDDHQILTACEQSGLQVYHPVAVVTETAHRIIKALRALGVITDTGQAIPEGWDFYTADFSVSPGSVLLIRDTFGKAIWHALPAEGRESVDLYITGKGKRLLTPSPMPAPKPRKRHEPG